MAICNRDLDASQQIYTLQSSSAGVVATGAIVTLGLVPSPSVLLAAKASAVGLSGSPVALLRIRRFITGSGATVYNGGATSLTLVATGTSGPQSVVIAASGSTALNLQAGDQLEAVISGANTAADALVVTAVIKATQDIRSYFGTSYTSA